MLFLNIYSQYIYFLFSDSQPSCSTETENDVVNASCSIGFSGNWPPVIEWYDRSGKLEANDTTTIPSQRVTSFLILPLNDDSRELYMLTCSVKFNIEDKPQRTTAANIPELFLSNCNTSTEDSGWFFVQQLL